VLRISDREDRVYSQFPAGPRFNGAARLSLDPTEPGTPPRPIFSHTYSSHRLDVDSSSILDNLSSKVTR
jgi:hypothetical protein